MFFMSDYSKIIDTPLGKLQVYCTENAITILDFSIDAEKESVEVPLILQNSLTQLQEYFEQKRTTFTLPLAPQGTPFQLSVWAALQEIPYGKTLSYLQLSQELGNEKAIRAVGTANGRNPIPIIIPCHRVIGSDNSLTGYAGGLWRKKWLLEHEGILQKGLFD